MRVTRKTRLRLRIDNLLFVALFLTAAGLLGWLSTRYHLQADWTAAGRNTLSQASRQLLEHLEGGVSVTAYAREDEVLRARIKDLVDRYRRHKRDLSLAFVNPDTVPDRVRDLGIAVDGELIVAYQGRSEHVQNHSEQALTVALQRLARAGERWLVFVKGHGERAPLGQANHDLGDFGRQLEQRGFNIQSLSLAEAGAVPENASLLVIASPQVSLLPAEVRIIQDYVAAGGNLLWLQDPGPLQGLAPLAEDLGLEFQPGVVVDPTTQLFGIEHPAMVLVTAYTAHPATRDFDLLTLFPQARGILADPPAPWTSEALLSTAAHAWSETGELAGEIQFDEGSDLPGPLDIGIALSRQPDAGAAAADANADGAARVQRVMVVGDGDFLSNAYLGNGGNLDLGFKLINWLSSDDALIAIPVKTAPDTSLAFSPAAAMTIGLGFLLGLPLLLLGAGLAIWWRRRKR